MKLGVATLKGTIEKNDNGDLVFSFAAFGKISLGKVNAHATKAGSTLNLTFDATRLIQIITKVAGALNNSSLNALTTLINSYDGPGVYIGNMYPIFQYKQYAKLQQMPVLHTLPFIIVLPASFPTGRR